jgi:hypothetical protein
MAGGILLNNALEHIKLTTQYHKMCRLIGDSDKTAILQEYLKMDKNAVYVCIPEGCSEKELITLLGKLIFFTPGKGTVAEAMQEMIAFLINHDSDTVFLIDNGENLLKYIDDLRYIWDYTNLNTSFVFAGTHAFEEKLQKDPYSHFIRRSSIYELKSA